MAGQAGTPRFGTNPNMHVDETTSDGMSVVDLQVDDVTFKEIHYAYNHGLLGRSMGSTEGTPPKGYYNVESVQADYMSNHAGYDGGDAHKILLDERKVLDNYIMATKIECADCLQNISGTRRTID